MEISRWRCFPIEGDLRTSGDWPEGVFSRSAGESMVGLTSPALMSCQNRDGERTEPRPSRETTSVQVQPSEQLEEVIIGERANPGS